MIDEAGRRDYISSFRQIAFMKYGRMEKWNGQPIDLLRWIFYLFGDPGLCAKLMVLSAALVLKDTCGCMLVVLSGYPHRDWSHDC